jgi:hypothetical protein
MVKVREKHLVTPFNAKAMALFTQRINGKIYHATKKALKIIINQI